MNKEESFCNSIYADQMRIAERELSSFIGAVTPLFSPEEAKLSAEDWLDSPRWCKDSLVLHARGSRAGRDKAALRGRWTSCVLG